MSATLIDSVKSVFTDVVISKFSGLLGESEGNTRKTLQAAIPMALVSILHKAGHQEEAAKIYNLSTQASAGDFFGHIHELTASPGSLLAGSALLSKGGEYTGSAFGASADAVIKEISRHTGVSFSSSSFLTGTASFAALDAIGRQIANSNLDTKGMVDWLALQSKSIINAIPSGLRVKESLGITHYPGESAVKSSRNMVLYIIIALIVIAAVIFMVYRSRNKADMVAPANTTDTLLPHKDSTASPVR